MEDDSHFQWLSPSEDACLPFARGRADALALASEWDLCISGDGLHHLHQIGADAAYVPLTQARPHAAGLFPPKPRAPGGRCILHASTRLCRAA